MCQKCAKIVPKMYLRPKKRVDIFFSSASADPAAVVITLAPCPRVAVTMRRSGVNLEALGPLWWSASPTKRVGGNGVAVNYL